MLQCPFCHFKNEDGSLYCEQCKSDLSMIPAAPPEDPDPRGSGSTVANATIGTASAIPEETHAVLASESVPEAVVVEEPAPAPAVAPSECRLQWSQWLLLVLRGQKIGVEYPLYDGQNFIGRADEKPVDIDLEAQEPVDRVWCSRQHACIDRAGDELYLEDLNSANGTYLNRNRVYPGQRQLLKINDTIQIGTVHLKVLAK
jgi:hypothetical protein